MGFYIGLGFNIGSGSITVAPDENVLPVSTMPITTTYPDVNFKRDYVLQVEPIVIFTDFPDVNLIRGISTSVDSIAITTTYPDVNFRKDYTLSVEPIAITTTYPDVNFSQQGKVTVDAMQISTTYPDVNFKRDYILQVDPIAITTTYPDVTFTLTPAPSAGWAITSNVLDQVASNWGGGAVLNGSGDIALLGITDSTNIKRYTTDGTNFTLQSETLSAGGTIVQNAYLRRSAENEFVYGYDNQRATRAQWNGSAFSNIGSTTTFGTNCFISPSSATRIFITKRSDGVECWDHNGTSYSQTGSTYTDTSLNFSNHFICVVNKTNNAERVVYWDFSNNTIFLLSFNGSTFTLLDSITWTLSTGGIPVLSNATRLTDTTFVIACGDNTGGEEERLIRFSIAGDTLTELETTEMYPDYLGGNSATAASYVDGYYNEDNALLWISRADFLMFKATWTD